jgi:hypothetical protein
MALPAASHFCDLRDGQWVLIGPFLPKLTRRKGGRGRPWRENRAVLNGILWILRTGAPPADRQPKDSRRLPRGRVRRRHRRSRSADTARAQLAPDSSAGLFVQVIANRQVELTEAWGIGEDVDLDDPSARFRPRPAPRGAPSRRLETPRRDRPATRHLVEDPEKRFEITTARCRKEGIDDFALASEIAVWNMWPIPARGGGRGSRAGRYRWCRSR